MAKSSDVITRRAVLSNLQFGDFTLQAFGISEDENMPLVPETVSKMKETDRISIAWAMGKAVKGDESEQWTQGSMMWTCVNK